MVAFFLQSTQAWRFRHSQCIRVHLLSSQIRAMIPSVAAIMTRRDITTPATIPPTVLPLSLVSSAVEEKCTRMRECCIIQHTYTHEGVVATHVPKVLAIKLSSVKGPTETVKAATLISYSVDGSNPVIVNSIVLPPVVSFLKIPLACILYLTT